ncbi:hypothetical protein LTR08_004470 [Meristemomyces frigidus]|nr:hypothetical protein LTR08_004470 [Meristemomyces frigidus]
MASTNHLKTIAIVGASGNVGASTLKHLLAADRFAITLILRPESKTVALPSHSAIIIKQGSWDDPAFLQDAFKGQDVAIFALGFMAMREQAKLVEAAAKAGVNWILPTEYAGDGNNEAMTAALPMFQPKAAARTQIEGLAKARGGQGPKWIGIATNPWLEQSLRIGLLEIKFGDKTAKLFPDAGAFNVSTLELVGLGITRLLSLPVKSEGNPRASLEHYANDFVYISSALVTQEKVFASVLRATKSSESEWKVDRESTIAQWIKDSQAKMAEGDVRAGAGLTFAMYMGEGKGGNYQDKALEDLKVLGLQEVDVDAEVAKAVALGPMPSPF